MNLHAHLFSNEIAGYNSGVAFKLQNDKALIVLQETLPCRPLEGTGVDRSKTVEIDPESS